MKSSLYSSRCVRSWVTTRRSFSFCYIALTLLLFVSQLRFYIFRFDSVCLVKIDSAPPRRDSTYFCVNLPSVHIPSSRHPFVFTLPLYVMNLHIFVNFATVLYRICVITLIIFFFYSYRLYVFVPASRRS